jgi:hypothetical protein
MELTHTDCSRGKDALCTAASLLKPYGALNLSNSLDVCYYLGEQADDIIFKNRATTPRDLINKLFVGHDPRSVHIRFWGGPPKRGAWYEGSFYSFILDRIARLLTEYGLDYTKRVLRFGISAVRED